LAVPSLAKCLQENSGAFRDIPGRCWPDWRVRVMQGKVKEQWVELCERAAIEQDAEKLLVLVNEINRMLNEKDRRLKRQPVNDESD
jgi:hypothetical protein